MSVPWTVERRFMAPLDSMFGMLDKIKSADISVYQQRCVAVRNRNASCMRCAQACTSGAISYDDNQLIIEPDKCIGCGTCATMCPTCALEAHRPNDAELQRAVLAAAQKNDGVAVIACRQIVDAAGNMLDASKVVAVECLGRIEESLITACAVAGVSKVMLVQGACAECDHAVGLETAQAVCDTANELLRVWDCPMRAKIVDRFPRDVRAPEGRAYDEVRRNFFFKVKDESKRIASTVVDETIKEELGEKEPEEPRFIKVMDDGTLPHFIPDRRERLLDNLAALGEPSDELIDVRLWGHVVIDPDICNSCRMCATFCPTGALRKFDEEDGTFGVDHYPGDCVKCRCCEDICPTKALKVYDEVLTVDILDGGVERNEMRKPDINYESPKKGMFAMRKLLGFDEVYER